MSIRISVQTEDFNVGEEYQALRSDDGREGAIALFSGLVRDMNLGDQVHGLHLEHYPGMTEKALQNIANQACERWPLQRVRIIHRIGQLQVRDQIVLVATSSAHRQAAFESCEFIMDFLKSRAPFWKKETIEGAEQDRWIEQKDSDKQAMDRWQNDPA